MKQAEQKYAVDRVQSIYREKKKKLDKECKIEGVKLTDKEKVELVRKGKVKILPDNKIEFGSYAFGLKHVYDFSKFEFDTEMTKGYEDKAKKLLQKCSEVKDHVMLGDAEFAFKLIQEFLKYEV